jgi:hypothetical protein
MHVEFRGRVFPREAFLNEQSPAATRKSALAQFAPGSAALALYAATGFLGAGLLFAVEPMISKMALPQLGGTPNVWTTCLLFFQAVLLLGYGYAHASTRWLSRGSQLGAQLALLVAVSLALPPTFSAKGLTPDQPPALWLVAQLAITAGPPFFAIAATTPLLQHWFSKIGDRDSADPYFLYAASNLGSLFALIAYPFVIEPNLPLDKQSGLWTQTFGVFASGLVICLAIYFVRSPTEASETGTLATINSARSSCERLRWVALAFVPSSLLLGFTTYITTDVAPTPLFWVLPLALYLLTFTFAFARRPPLRHAAMMRLLPISLIPFALFIPLLPRLPLALMLALSLGCFFVIAMVCHGELARQRPQVSRLTEFYFCLSLGGVMGGVFNAMLAPPLFPDAWELPLVLTLAGLLLPRNRARRRFELGYDLLLPAALFIFLIAVRMMPVPHWPPILLGCIFFVIFAAPALMLMSFRHRPLRFALGIVVCFVEPALALNSPSQKLATYRDFFGVYRVIDIDDRKARILTHGTTIHGAASLRPGEATIPGSYYSREGPFGGFFGALNSRARKPTEVAIIGLGTGELGCYATPDQHWTFFEIDPLVERISRQFFHFMARCGNNPRVVLGDARLTLAGVRDGLYDALVIDAFSSDNVPTHLLTKEAFALYFKKLAPRGVLLFHLSNRYLNLDPVIAAVADSLGVQARRLSYRPAPGMPSWQSAGADVVAVAAPGGDLDFLARPAGWSIPPTPPAYAFWTDQRSDILRTIRWLRY